MEGSKGLKIVLFGPPGCGKGTQARLLTDSFGIQHVSSGDLMRQEVDRGTETGQAIRAKTQRGELVPDSIVNRLVFDRLRNQPGYVLDGYPRSTTQAQLLGKNIDLAFYIEVDEAACIERILKRGEGRSDDSEEVAKRRWTIYLQETRPIVSFYESLQKLIKIDGSRPRGQVFESLKSAVEAYLIKCA
jgi:adenylate kinase